MQLTQDQLAKYDQLMACGLSIGLGTAEPGKMCIEAVWCQVLGLPHGDDPGCVSGAVRRLKIKLNDSKWASNAARSKGLYRLGLVQIGTLDVIDDNEFRKRIVDLAIRKMVPIALRAAASIHKNQNHREAMITAAFRCEAEGTRDSAEKARVIGRAAVYAADAAADASAVYAAVYAVYAADASAASAVYAAVYADAADAVADADAAVYADAADAVADAAADAAIYAAAAAAAADYAAVYAAAAAAAAAAARDKFLANFAEDVVQILIDMKAPGAQYLG